MTAGQAAVIGSGPGGLAIAADLAAAGRSVRIADLPGYGANVDAVRARGGVGVLSGWHGQSLQPVEAAPSIPEAVTGAELVVVSVRAPAHDRCVRSAMASLEPGAALLFMGEGGGALVAHLLLAEADRRDVTTGETNSLPFVARLAGPGVVSADRKRGGLLLAGIPAASGSSLAVAIGDVWPFAEVASSIWDTILLNFDAIDVVPVAVSNAATLEVRPGGMLLWAEGASPGVIRLIERLDGELLAIRRALGTEDTRRYRDFLIAQGLAQSGTSLREVLRSSMLMRGVRASGTSQDLRGLLDVAVPFSLVFAASIADAAGVAAPVINALIEVASALADRDFMAEGRTLAGLGLTGLDAAGLRMLATAGRFP